MKYIRTTSFNNYIQANITLGLLQENGIDCHLEDEKYISVDPILNPSVGGNLMVAEPDIEKAKEIIKQAEATYIKDEIPCPVCKNNALIVEEKTTLPASFWQRAKNQVLFGQPSTYSKLYKCEHCKSIFTELPAAD